MSFQRDLKELLFLTAVLSVVPVIMIARHISDDSVLIYDKTFPISSVTNGKIIRKDLKSVYLEKTVTNESHVRQLSIYLPPSYDDFNDKKYPVIYLLNGVAGTDQDWTVPWRNNKPLTTIQNAMDEGISSGKFGEMIVVMPNQNTNWHGSFYKNSPVTGDWEKFATEEMIAFMDENFRTIPESDGRGIAGHSMGGYGAITLGMKYPETFSVVYGMSPGIIDFTKDLSINSQAFKNAIKAKSYDDLKHSGDVLAMGIVAMAQAFSPNPKKLPFFCELPFAEENGKMRPNPEVIKLWRENSPIRMVENCHDNLIKLKAIKFDVGVHDNFRFILDNSRAFSMELTNYGIEHIYEEYDGDHGNRLWGVNGRIYNHVLPFFWQQLAKD